MYKEMVDGGSEQNDDQQRQAGERTRFDVDGYAFFH